MAEQPGKTGLLSIQGDFRPRVRILEVRHAYGRTRYVVTPTDGEGQETVDSSRVDLDEGEQ